MIKKKIGLKRSFVFLFIFVMLLLAYLWRFSNTKNEIVGTRN